MYAFIKGNLDKYADRHRIFFEFNTFIPERDAEIRRLFYRAGREKAMELGAWDLGRYKKNG